MLNLTPHTIIITEAQDAEHKLKSVVLPPSGTIAKIVVSKTPGVPIDFIDPTGIPVLIPIMVESPVGIVGIPIEDIQIEIEGLPQQNEICIVSREVLAAAQILNHPALPRLYAPGDQIIHKPGSQNIIGCKYLITHLQDKTVKNLG